MARDPVCGMDIEEADAAGTSNHKGKTYYFCCTSCKEQFDRAPEKYASKD
jgi:Cu+-exporting ATPase